MKILRTFVIGCLALAPATCHLHAAPKKAAAPPPAAPAPAAKPAKPQGFNLEADEVTAKGFTHVLKDGAKQTMTVTDKTVITNAGAPAKLADIKPGDVVSGSRLKVSDTEYDLIKITGFAPKPAKGPKGKK